MFRHNAVLRETIDPRTGRHPDMTVYETTNHTQIRLWCEANRYWPGCPPGSPDRPKIGGCPYIEPEELELLDWDEWFAAFDARNFKFVYDPTKGWCDIQSNNVKVD
jgi:hypothetical protein